MGGKNIHHSGTAVNEHSLALQKYFYFFALNELENELFAICLKFKSSENALSRRQLLQSQKYWHPPCCQMLRLRIK